MGLRTPQTSPDRLHYGNLKYRIYTLLEVGDGGRIGKLTDIFIMLLIVANVGALMLETVDWIYRLYGKVFILFEIISVAIFTAEYLGRLWVSTELDAYRNPITGRLKFAASPYMIVDLLAILPFFVGAIFLGGVDLRFLRGLRLFRFFRLFKLTRYSESLQIFTESIRIKKNELFITFCIGVVLMVVASSAMYFAERHAQPETFRSIPSAIWWGAITLTTVGYGDVHPVTPIGRAIGVVVSFIGIGIVALPASILASGFIEVARGDVGTCPHCGEKVTDDEMDSRELL